MACFGSKDSPNPDFGDNYVSLIEQPAIPFIHKLKTRLEPRSDIIVLGVVDNNATRFAVNLLMGHSEKSDIAFHFNPRLEQLYVARNSLFNGKWGTEEGSSQVKFPFRCGQPFFLEIFVSESAFMVAVDGINICLYHYRTQLAKIASIQVEGGVQVSQLLLLREASCFPSPVPDVLLYPENKINLKYDGDTSNTAQTIFKLKSKLHNQSSIIVQGVTNDNFVRFEINLLMDHGEKPDIAFHFNPRLDLQYTARNSRFNGKWGLEDADSNLRFPFRRNKTFYVEIHVTKSKFLIAVDGMHYCSYKHRTSTSLINNVQVVGGVKLSQILLHSSPYYPLSLSKLLKSTESKQSLQAGGINNNSTLTVPFVYKFPSRLHPQSSIIVQGVVNYDAVRFKVNLVIGHDEDPDIAFHLNPRMDQSYVARNSCLDNKWGIEEGDSEQKFPFHCGQPFYLEIYLTDSMFKVAVNGTHYCSYNYRTSLVKITSIAIDGGVKLSQVLLQDTCHYPSAMPELLQRQESKPLLQANKTTVKNMMTTPFVDELSYRLHPQNSIIIQGLVNDNALRFEVNLVIGCNEKPDIALHLNPRFDKQYCARNSRFNGSWGKEEGNCQEKIVFHQGRPFFLEIHLSESKFLIAVDGEHFCSYNYRIPLVNITSIQIDGGVKLSEVLVHATTNYPSPVPQLEVVPAPEHKSQLSAAPSDFNSVVAQDSTLVHDLKAKLHPQSSIFVHGVIDDRATRLAINLVTGRHERSDIAFHFNPRLDQLYSARNSRLDNRWGPEEGNSHHRFPFQRGKPFFVEIFLTHTEFLVAVNGVHYCSFKYRTSLSHVISVHVEGRVKQPHVDVRPSSNYPSSLPSEFPPPSYMFPLQDKAIAKIDNQITPVYGLFKEKLRMNSEIEIHGRVKLLPYSFFINLQDGSEVWPHPKIPLHISVRFCQGGDHVILANAWLTKSWGREEITQTKCLFTPGYPFTVKILCHKDTFVAKVDDQPILAFKHRTSHADINTLLIQGDVYIYDVSLRL